MYITQFYFRRKLVLYIYFFAHALILSDNVCSFQAQGLHHHQTGCNV
uniref:Uncharacterized protein n=1 Tax=Lepeophtheirus salmonis TaxID=72036 RepID=A0A0K2UZ05_LEPSM